MCLLSSVPVVPTWAPAVRAFTELHPARSSCVPGSMGSHGIPCNSCTMKPQSLYCRPRGWCKLKKQAPACEFSVTSNRILGASFVFVCKGHGEKLQYCQSRWYLWHTEHPVELKGDCSQPFSIPAAKRSFLLDEKSISYLSARAGPFVYGIYRHTDTHNPLTPVLYTGPEADQKSHSPCHCDCVPGRPCWETSAVGVIPALRASFSTSQWPCCPYWLSEGWGREGDRGHECHSPTAAPIYANTHFQTHGPFPLKVAKWPQAGEMLSIGFTGLQLLRKVLSLQYLFSQTWLCAQSQLPQI